MDLAKNPLKDLSKGQRTAVIIGSLGIGGLMVFSHHKKTGSWNPFNNSGAAGAAGTPSAQTGTDPITGMPYSSDSATDPITGMTYLAEAQQYGSVAAAEASVSAYGQSTATGSGIPVNPASPPSSGTPNPPVGSSVYTSDAAWSQAAQAGLTSIGYDGVTVGEALGAFLTGTPQTPEQIKIINAAIAEFGRPPVGSYQIIPIPPQTPSPKTVKVPNVIGMKFGAARTRITNAGLKVKANPGWTVNKIVHSQSPSANASVASGSTVTVVVK